MKYLIPILILLPCLGFSQAGLPNSSNGNHPDRSLRVVPSVKKLPLHSSLCFVQNIGQYDDPSAAFQQMGWVQYGFEGLDMPVLFTAKGLLHLHRRAEKEKERHRKNSNTGEEEEEWKITDKLIYMEWLGANPAVEIIAGDARTDYHTYGLLPQKARLYNQLIYKELYPHIDVVFHFNGNSRPGFEYSIIVKPGGDPSLVKMKYGGDLKKIRNGSNGALIISSSIDGISESAPKAFTSNDTTSISLLANRPESAAISCAFQREGNRVSFSAGDYDHTQTLIIDPFVSSTSNLTGTNSGKAKDIDFDYDGNVYVTGGGNASIHQLAKYNAAGVLQWTFSGSLTLPSWTFGTNMGGWVVDKTSGKTYLGQGVNINGSRIVRLDANGVFDNYITNIDPSFWENWRMLWRCNNGTPQILVTGGGITTNINLAICTPPSTQMVGTNMTGITSSYAQDIVDVVIDPANNDMYSVFASAFLTPFVNNRIYKHSSPYGAGNIQWERYSGYTTLREPANRPYLTSGNTDNSANVFAINSTYLFYWDGRSLKAFNKSDGSDAGIPFDVPAFTPLMVGGIYADECNHVFIGFTNGTIKVFSFTGIFFDDAAAPDITIPDNPLASVYDLAYDEAHQLLYASGDGFVGSFDISSYCTTTAVYTLSVNTNCPNLSAQATVSPAPPPGTVLTYVLFNGSTQLASNGTGLFTGLSTGINYTIKLFLNQACSGLQLLTNFNLGNCALQASATGISPTCHDYNNGSITVVAGGGTPPYRYSIDGINFQLTGFFSGLTANNYTVTVLDAANLQAITNITLVNPPLLQLMATGIPQNCTLLGSITAAGSGGTPGLLYSLDGILFQPNPVFNGLTAATYPVTVKDANGCTATAPVQINLVSNLLLDAGNAFTICQGQSRQMNASSNGSSFAWSPATGLSDPLLLNPVAAPVTSTAYTLTAKLGFCSSSASVMVTVFPAPIPNAGPDTTICFGQRIQLQGSGGTDYQWRPVSLLAGYNTANPFLTGSTAGHITYFLSVTDANGCHSLQTDAVTVSILQPAKLFAGNDTVVAINQPLPLHAADVNHIGFINYTWSPVYGLNNASIADPLCIPDRDLIYTVTAATKQGCVGMDDIKIKVYKGPEIYVPGAFTPNHDNRNDILRAIPVGIKEFRVFSIYNRFGELLFSTSDPAVGWDGSWKGMAQSTGAYVWIAEGIDYRGNVLKRKGSFVLLR